MVEETNLEGNIVFKCEECGMKYKNKVLAQKCEDYCRKNQACSLDITKYAVKLK